MTVLKFQPDRVSIDEEAVGSVYEYIEAYIPDHCPMGETDLFASSYYREYGQEEGTASRFQQKRDRTA